MDAFADHFPEQLLALVRNHLDPSGLTAKFAGRIALTDGLIHQQDIRRPLGMQRAILAERIVPWSGSTGRATGIRR